MAAITELGCGTAVDMTWRETGGRPKLAGCGMDIDASDCNYEVALCYCSFSVARLTFLSQSSH
jgi:hypothetical protein